ncbi:hypothetical protein Tco_0306174, partial [Tanacetum coccineum]
GFGFCAIFRCKKPFSTFEGISVKNFDGASFIESSDYIPPVVEKLLKREAIGTQDSYMIWLHYTRIDRWEWENAKNFVTFCFGENNEGVEVKECGVRLICDEDIQQGAESSMLQGLSTPTQHHGGFVGLYGEVAFSNWSW